MNNKPGEIEHRGTTIYVSLCAVWDELGFYFRTKEPEFKIIGWPHDYALGGIKQRIDEYLERH
jgi:hypothetical protein